MSLSILCVLEVFYFFKVNILRKAGIFQSLKSSAEEEVRSCVSGFKDEWETKFFPDGCPRVYKKLSFILQ